MRRLPVYLLIDTSGSMKGEPIESVKVGLSTLVSSLRSDPHAMDTVNLSLMKGSALVGVDVRQFLLFEKDLAKSHMAEMMAWVEEGRLVPPTGRSFPFVDFAAAMEFAMSGAGTAKTTIQVAADQV